MFAKKLIWLAIITAAAAQQPRAEQRESLGDAWWTGPMLPPSANTLPSGLSITPAIAINYVR